MDTYPYCHLAGFGGVEELAIALRMPASLNDLLELRMTF